MNPKLLVRLSNIVGIISILLLIYWIFTFISIEVFGFKVFREYITNTFYMSVFGILALMFGALIINVMFNLTRIAERHNSDNSYTQKHIGKYLVVFALTFPIIFGFLFGGDYLSSKRKEEVLIQTAESIIKDNKTKVDLLSQYTFDEEWIKKTSKDLLFLSKTDRDFPNVSLLVRDEIDGSPVYLSFNGHYSDYIDRNDTIAPSKLDYISETTSAEREYLQAVFDKKKTESLFNAKDGNYELFYPYIDGEKIIVLHFSDYQRYGKVGSY